MNFREFRIVFKQQNKTKMIRKCLSLLPKRKAITRIRHTWGCRKGLLSDESGDSVSPTPTPSSPWWPCLCRSPGLLSLQSPWFPSLWWLSSSQHSAQCVPVSSLILSPLPFRLSASNPRALWLLESKEQGDRIERPACSGCQPDPAGVGDSVSPLQPHPVRKMWREHGPGDNQSLEWGPDYLPGETVIYG